MSKLTTRLTAMLLSGILVIGSVSGSVSAAEIDFDPGQTSEVAFEEDAADTQDAYEDTADPGITADENTDDAVDTQDSYEDTADPGITADENANDTANGDEYSEDSTTGDLTYEETNTDEETAQYYTVTLDANGGYFMSEWDDSIGDYAEQAEVISKLVPIDGTVAAYPVFTETDQDGQQIQTMSFAGWSLERDGELITEGNEEYAPVDSYTLYAVWEIFETVTDEGAGQETAEETVEDTQENETTPAPKRTAPRKAADLGAEEPVIIEEEGEEESDSTDAAMSAEVASAGLAVLIGIAGRAAAPAQGAAVFYGSVTLLIARIAGLPAELMVLPDMHSRLYGDSLLCEPRLQPALFENIGFHADTIPPFHCMIALEKRDIK